MYVLMCSSLGLSCLGLSVFPGLGWLFLFPCSGIFQLLFLPIFSHVLSLSLLLLGPPIMSMLVCLMLSQRSLRLSFHSFFYILFCGSDFHPSIMDGNTHKWPPGHLSVLLPQLFCYWFLLVYYSGEGNGTSFQYSCLENPMDRGAW